MFALRHPPLARITARLERANVELANLSQYVKEAGDSAKTPTTVWGVTKIIASSVADVYNGMEDALKDIASVVDDYVPPHTSQWHQDLLDQMSAPVKNGRDAVLGPDLSRAMNELKDFRHVVRHNYGVELKSDRVRANYDLVRVTFPKFVAAVVELDRKLADELKGPRIP